jgi:hypothetical protein
MKTVSVGEAVSIIPDGATLMIGGFMGVGTTRTTNERGRQLRRPPYARSQSQNRAVATSATDRKPRKITAIVNQNSCTTCAG